MRDSKSEFASKHLYLNDRRTMDRFLLQDVKIALVVHAVTKPDVKLVDISHTSVRVITSVMLHEKQEIQFSIQVPGLKPLTLKGFVIRIEEFPSKEGTFMIAIKFHPFSTYERYNTMENRKLLKEILDKGQKI